MRWIFDTQIGGNMGFLFLKHVEECRSRLNLSELSKKESTKQNNAVLDSLVSLISGLLSSDSDVDREEAIKCLAQMYEAFETDRKPEFNIEGFETDCDSKIFTELKASLVAFLAVIGDDRNLRDIKWHNDFTSAAKRVRNILLALDDSKQENE